MFSIVQGTIGAFHRQKIISFFYFKDTPFRNQDNFSVKGNMGVNNIKNNE